MPRPPNKVVLRNYRAHTKESLVCPEQELPAQFSSHFVFIHVSWVQGQRRQDRGKRVGGELADVGVGEVGNEVSD